MTANRTIAEIAEHAGVSTATVDRVLNRRPGVNAETVRKVVDTVAALGASAPVRGRPKKSENYRFAFVLPATRLPFFDLVDRLIAQFAGDFRHSHVTEVTHRLDCSDPAAFAQELAHFEDFDGVALLAPDSPPIKLAVNELVRAGVHVVTLFSDIAGSMRETFIGADNRAAGRTAGLLLGRMAGPAASGKLALAAPATRYSAEIDRQIGFAQVIEERFPQLGVVRIADLPESEEGAFEAGTRAFAEWDGLADVVGLYNVGSGTFGISRALAAHGAGPGFGVVAHDLTETNRSLLVSGAISYVLHQDLRYCTLAAARVLRALCEHVRGALAVAQPRVEILTAENLS